jgi:hypothetical protein
MANKKDSEMFDIYKKGIFALNKVVPFGRDMVSFRSRGYVIDDNI